MQTYALKFILIGDSGVGKSQLAKRFTRKEFRDDSTTTVGMEFSTRDIVFERCTIKAQIWDTAGQERFENMTKAYYRDAVGAMLVYDVSKQSSFDNLKNVWIPQLFKYGHEKMTCILVGNKADSNTSQRRVSSYDATAYAESKHLDFIETSALTGENVERAFRRLVLSVARLLPDVRLHLELTGLPDGWLSQYRISTPSPSSSHRHITDNSSSSYDHQSSNPVIEAGNKSPGNNKSSNRIMDMAPVTPTIGKLKGSTVNSSVATSDGIQLYDSSSSSLSTYDHGMCSSPTTMTDTYLTLSPSNITVTPELMVIYTNYWSGEETMEVPKYNAPTGFFFEAKMNPAERFSEFDQPIKRETMTNPDYNESILQNGKSTGNVIVSKYDAITTKSPRLSASAHGKNHGSSHESIQPRKSRSSPCRGDDGCYCIIS